LPEIFDFGQTFGLPAASAFTSAVVRGLPPTAHSLLLTSSTTTHVTARMFSPSNDTIVSVNLRITSCFCACLKTPSTSFTFGRVIYGERTR